MAIGFAELVPGDNTVCILLDMVFLFLFRKNQVAVDHFQHRILKKYFLVWRLWLRQERHSRELEHQQTQTKSKMAAFLEAAASGKLWTSRSEEEETGDSSAREGRKEASDRPDSVAQKLVCLLCFSWFSPLLQ